MTFGIDSKEGKNGVAICGGGGLGVSTIVERI